MPIAEGEVDLSPSPTISGPVEYLGGGVNRVSSEASECPAYASLPRPVKLPPATCKFKKVSKGAKTAFLQLWEGKCTVKWTLVSEKTLELEATPFAHANLPEKFAGKLVTVGYFNRQLIPNMFLSFNIAGGESEQRDFESSLFHSTDHNPEFGAAFDEEVRSELATRVLHNFLRSHGNLFMMNYAQDLVIPALQCLNNFYQQKDYLTQMLDIAVLRTDLEINANRSQKEIGKSMIKIGEALETLGKFGDAAAVYERLETKYYTQSLSMSDHAMAIGFAGLAHKRNGQLQKAEEFYIRDLYFRRLCTSGGRSLDLNEHWTSGLLLNMLSLYQTMQERDNSRENMFFLLGALLLAAGWQNPHYGDNINSFRNLLPMLKPKFQSKNAAVKALTDAAAHPQKRHFYQVLEACRVPNCRTVYQSVPQTEEEARQQHINSARRVVTGMSQESTQLFPCGYGPCQNRSDSTKCCPCKSKR